MARTLQQASLVMLLGIGRPVFACDIACYNTCVQNCEAMCDQSDDCSAVVMTYVPGAAVDGSDVASVPGSSPVSVSSQAPPLSGAPRVGPGPGIKGRFARGWPACF